MQPRYPNHSLSFFLVLLSLFTIYYQDVQAATTSSPTFFSTNPIFPQPYTYIPSDTNGIMGYLSLDMDGMIPPPMRVTAYQRVKGGWKNVAVVYSDADNVYLFKDLPPGSYRLRFSDPSKLYKTEYYDDVTSLRKAVDIVVVEKHMVAGINASLALAEPGVMNLATEDE